MEPAQIPIKGILPARGLSRVKPKANEPSQVISGDSHDAIRVQNSCKFVMVTNFSNEELTIPNGTLLGVTDEMTELVDRINAGDIPKYCPLNNRQRKK